MMILNRQPIFAHDWIVPTPDGAEEVRPYQIIVFVSITARDVTEPPEDAMRIPAILDTGNNHNFAIREVQLERWAPPTLPEMGHVQVNGLIVPLLSARIWIHTNHAGTIESSGGSPFKLEATESVIVYPSHISNPARLPILGLRALIRNGLKLTLEGAARELSLESPSPG